jgi:Domain of unknown function (DUF1905)
MDDQIITFSGPVWLWRAPPPAKGAWHFLTIDGQSAAEIRYASLGRTGGFGSVRVTATVGETSWQTSLFRAGKSDGYMLPLKADVRKREGVSEGDVITVMLEV